MQDKPGNNPSQFVPQGHFEVSSCQKETQLGFLGQCPEVFLPTAASVFQQVSFIDKYAAPFKPFQELSIILLLGTDGVYPRR
jgi:hypothetical protein